jgi:hypothetical protein
MQRPHPGYDCWSDVPQLLMLVLLVVRVLGVSVRALLAPASIAVLMVCV